MKSKKFIAKPCVKEVDFYLDKWKTLDNYVAQEKCLNKIFKAYPKNDNIEDILTKSGTLNDFYSTNIFAIYKVAKHILDLKIDEKLKTGDLSVVNEIAKITIKNKYKNFYAFATKYCSHHFPEIYPIYDSFVEKVLMYFKGVDKFATFKKEDLKDYTKYVEIIKAFIKFYGLQKYSFKQIDRYLWLLGKEKFGKTQNEQQG